MEYLNIAFPSWIDRLPQKGRQRARVRFMLQLAATLATPEGSISALSHRIGFHRNTLNTMISNGSMDDGIPVNVIKGVEKLIGFGTIPRHLMNENVYGEK